MDPTGMDNPIVDPCDESKCSSALWDDNHDLHFCYGNDDVLKYRMACTDGYVPKAVEDEPALTFQSPYDGRVTVQYFTCCPPDYLSNNLGTDVPMKRHCSSPRIADVACSIPELCDNQKTRKHPRKNEHPIWGVKGFYSCCDAEVAPSAFDTNTNNEVGDCCVPYFTNVNRGNSFGYIEPVGDIMKCKNRLFPYLRGYTVVDHFTDILVRYECCRNPPGFQYSNDFAFKITLSLELIVYTAAAVATATIAIGLLIPLLIGLKRKSNPRRNARMERKSPPQYSPYNLYLVYLAIPDLVIALFQISIILRMFMQKNVPHSTIFTLDGDNQFDDDIFVEDFSVVDDDFDKIVCPGQLLENFCDCFGDCVNNPERCGCEEAQECCKGNFADDIFNDDANGEVAEEDNFDGLNWIWALQFSYVMANLCINAIVSYEVITLLKTSTAVKKVGPPSLKRVNMQSWAVYVGAVLFGCGSRRLSGMYKEDILPYVMLGLALPILFVICVAFLVWYHGYLPSLKNANTPNERAMRSLAIYFFRIVLVFLVVWIPGIGFFALFRNYGPSAGWALFLARCTPAVQALASTAMVLTKADVRQHMLNLLTLYNVFGVCTRSKKGSTSGSNRTQMTAGIGFRKQSETLPNTDVIIVTTGIEPEEPFVPGKEQNQLYDAQLSPIEESVMVDSDSSCFFNDSESDRKHDSHFPHDVDRGVQNTIENDDRDNPESKKCSKICKMDGSISYQDQDRRRFSDPNSCN